MSETTMTKTDYFLGIAIVGVAAQGASKFFNAAADKTALANELQWFADLPSAFFAASGGVMSLVALGVAGAMAYEIAKPYWKRTLK